MACSSCGSGSSCGCSVGGFTLLDSSSLKQTMIQALIPAVDAARDVATQLGARPYQVWRVWTQWSGGARGVGVEQVFREDPMLPTPNVGGVSSLSRELQMFGTEESGTTNITEISARYTEDDLLGREPGALTVADDLSFYWEIRYPQNDFAVRRRFVTSGAPEFQPKGIQWTIRLTKAIENRSSLGETEG